MTIQQIKEYLHAEGFNPAIKTLEVGEKKRRLIGLSFNVSPIVKDRWMDYLKNLCAGDGFNIYYDQRQEEINIDIPVSEPIKVYSENNTFKVPPGHYNKIDVSPFLNGSNFIEITK